MFSIGGVLIVGLINQMWVLSRLRRRFDEENRWSAKYDSREHVLLLRSFESQILKQKSNLPEPGNLLQQISGDVPAKFAVVCIGAGESIRGLLSPADYVALRPSNQDWFQVFVLMAAGVRAVIVTPDVTPDCLTELRAISRVSSLLARTFGMDGTQLSPGNCDRLDADQV